MLLGGVWKRGIVLLYKYMYLKRKKKKKKSLSISFLKIDDDGIIFFYNRFRVEKQAAELGGGCVCVCVYGFWWENESQEYYYSAPPPLFQKKNIYIYICVEIFFWNNRV